VARAESGPYRTRTCAGRAPVVPKRRAGCSQVTYFSVRNVMAVCGALFVLALAFLVLAEGRDAGEMLNAFRSQSLVSKLAWAVIVLVPLILGPAAVWLSETLVRQRQAAQAL